MDNIRFTISGRSKDYSQPIIEFLAQHFGNVPLSSIDSIFAFVEMSTLYGGRPFMRPELTDADVQQMYNVDIGVRLPLSNHDITSEEYAMNAWLLDKYNREGNAVIVTNDDLAQWIREDFPAYRIEASVIKNINSHKKIEGALELYDTVVLPMKICNDQEFLAAIDCKERITLFANAGCALTCPSKICYPAISRMNKFTGAEFACSRSMKEREILGMVDFDLEPLIELGFRRFKMLRSKPGAITGY